MHAVLSREVASQAIFASSVQGARRIRGSGIYPTAANVNHECVPNVARTDAFDSTDSCNTRIALRTLHELPPGEEILLSYMPLHSEVDTRQLQCQDVYGFECSCPRCLCEMQGGEDAPGDSSDTALDPTYLQMFLLKYTCSVDECYGTYVPVEGSAEGRVCCNMCGHQRTEADFSLEVEQLFCE